MFTSKYLTPSTSSKTDIQKDLEKIRKLTNASEEESTVDAVKRVVEKLESTNNILQSLNSVEYFMNELQEVRSILNADSEESTLNAVKRFVAYATTPKAPLSYITPEGCVKLPKFAMVALGLKDGGGVVFHTTDKEGQVTILSNEEALKLLGE